MRAVASAIHQDRARPWFKHPWLWFLLAPPIISVVAGSYMASVAYRSQDAMVVDDYYKEGKAINQDLRRDKAAVALHLNALMNYDAARGIVNGRMNPIKAIHGGNLTVKFIHPTQPSKDLAIATHVDEAGNFSLVLPMLDRALWQVTLEDQEHQWRLSGVWNWPQQQGMELDPL
ncbi:FixH family protein [Undibacterium terreum]|uniref:Membrane protein n=1 Tax=Undibacterium terreum TaxID=1224302 RepID=A0A916XGD4_9BURK|nr:FixH family protein [Undibacterium terreum]GGC70109.1 membrane protein [Undibacterium terreum]